MLNFAQRYRTVQIVCIQWKRCLSRTTFKMGRSVKTIYALSSGQGPAGLAVIRASGPRCSDVLKEVTKQSHLPRPRMAVNRDIFSPLSGELLDKSIVLWFPGELTSLNHHTSYLECSMCIINSTSSLHFDLSINSAVSICSVSRLQCAYLSFRMSINLLIFSLFCIYVS